MTFQIDYFISLSKLLEFNAHGAKRQENLTADFRRLSQMRIRTFHRRDAEGAENRLFVCREITTDKNIALVKTTSFAQSSSPDWAKILALASFASLQLAPWNIDSTEVEVFARSAIPQGESSSFRG